MNARSDGNLLVTKLCSNVKIYLMKLAPIVKIIPLALLVLSAVLFQQKQTPATAQGLTAAVVTTIARPALAQSSPDPALSNAPEKQQALKSAYIASTSISSCAESSLGQVILVSISQRHLWACQGTTTAYDSPVITGMEMYAADLTPPGTYYVYGKHTNTVLRGSDSTGSWDDADNQYGQYGFHDATWRSDSAFGNTDPDSADASHGCVELPLATAAWLYNWSSIGTEVIISN
jgi:lipoprotein-anchoring transpeptidase ErfK/SrfK